LKYSSLEQIVWPRILKDGLLKLKSTHQKMLHSFAILGFVDVSPKSSKNGYFGRLDLDKLKRSRVDMYFDRNSCRAARHKQAI
jgi:hypothetical protein